MYIYREETRVLELDFSESLDALPDFQPSMLISKKFRRLSKSQKYPNRISN
jgi:hypothetical protein